MYVQHEKKFVQHKGKNNQHFGKNIYHRKKTSIITEKMSIIATGVQHPNRFVQNHGPDGRMPDRFFPPLRGRIGLRWPNRPFRNGPKK
ncbi:MAG: hypothetical protein BAA03_01520 [Caldibacillus debilis]|nr:MAG: hypothetical protein BAA03_01520 [Caldibacillus debilis]